MNRMINKQRMTITPATMRNLPVVKKEKAAPDPVR
jgi:hypothetical protein